MHIRTIYMNPILMSFKEMRQNRRKAQRLTSELSSSTYLVGGAGMYYIVLAIIDFICTNISINKSMVSNYQNLSDKRLRILLMNT